MLCCKPHPSFADCSLHGLFENSVDVPEPLYWSLVVLTVRTAVLEIFLTQAFMKRCPERNPTPSQEFSYMEALSGAEKQKVQSTSKKRNK